MIPAEIKEKKARKERKKVSGCKCEFYNCQLFQRQEGSP